MKLLIIDTTNAAVMDNHTAFLRDRAEMLQDAVRRMRAAKAKPPAERCPECALYANAGAFCDAHEGDELELATARLAVCDAAEELFEAQRTE